MSGMAGSDADRGLLPATALTSHYANGVPTLLNHLMYLIFLIFSSGCTLISKLFNDIFTARDALPATRLRNLTMRARM
ncbi:MAG TPA: hypothetical protein PLS34_09150 [Gammaproteobacteria bacterium]|nr:hypothetical protein [Gammaproteobacteria bacterium]